MFDFPDSRPGFFGPGTPFQICHSRTALVATGAKLTIPSSEPGFNFELSQPLPRGTKLLSGNQKCIITFFTFFVVGKSLFYFLPHPFYALHFHITFFPNTFFFFFAKHAAIRFHSFSLHIFRCCKANNEKLPFGFALSLFLSPTETFPKLGSTSLNSS